MTAHERGGDVAAEVVVGVDSHADQHTVVAINGLGQVLATTQIETTVAGYRDLVAWAGSLGRFERAGVEGCGAYGAGLARHLAGVGIRVIEVDRPNRQRRRRRGKSDPTDAEAAARAVLANDATTIPKDTTGVVEAIRIVHVTRRSALKAKTQAANQIRDLVLTAPDAVRAELHAKTTIQRVKLCAAWEPVTITDPTSALRRCLHDLAQRWIALDTQIGELDTELAALVKPLVPTVLAERGVGIDVAVKLVIAAGENPERLHSEAAFAALCGVSPVEASSGKQSHRRLNRGGNRQANNALHTVALCRWRTCPTTRDYIAKRRADGKTDRAIRRCLKRAIARRLHRLLITDLANHLT